MSEFVAMPGAEQVPEGVRYGYRTSYRNFDPRQPRLVLHTIEGALSRAVAANHRYPPQLWYSPSRRELYQTMDLSGPAMSLEHRTGDPETNHEGPCFQVELEGFAGKTKWWPTSFLRNIAEDVVAPLEQLSRDLYGTGFLSGTIHDGVDPTEVNYTLASYNSPLRMSWLAWRNFRGITDHNHVPGNAHWDTGGLDIPTIARFAGSGVGVKENDMELVTYAGNVAITDGIMKQVVAPGSAWHGILGKPKALDAASFNALLPADRVWRYLNELRDDEANITAAVNAARNATIAAVKAAAGSGGTGPDVDPEVIADAVADELAARLAS